MELHTETFTWLLFVVLVLLIRWELLRLDQRLEARIIRLEELEKKTKRQLKTYVSQHMCQQNGKDYPSLELSHPVHGNHFLNVSDATVSLLEMETNEKIGLSILLDRYNGDLEIIRGWGNPYHFVGTCAVIRKF